MDRRVEDSLVARDDPQRAKDECLQAPERGVRRQHRLDEPGRVLEHGARSGEARSAGPARGLGRVPEGAFGSGVASAATCAASSRARPAASPRRSFVIRLILRPDHDARRSSPPPARRRPARPRPPATPPGRPPGAGLRPDPGGRGRSGAARGTLRGDADCRPLARREAPRERPAADVRGRERRGLLVGRREEAHLPVDEASPSLRPDLRRRRRLAGRAASRLDRQGTDDLRVLLPGRRADPLLLDPPRRTRLSPVTRHVARLRLGRSIATTTSSARGPTGRTSGA